MGRVLDLLDTHTARIVQVLGMFTITLVVVFALIDRANLSEDNRKLIANGLVERSAASQEREKLIQGQSDLRNRIRELRQQNERVVEYLRQEGINIPGSVLSGTPTRVYVEDADDSDDSDNNGPSSSNSSTPNTPTSPSTPSSAPDGDILGDIDDTLDGITGMLPDVLEQTEPLLGQP